MLVLAMAPPMSLGGKILVGLMMLFLAAALVRAIRGVQSTGRSIRIAVLAAVAMVVVLEALLPSSYGGGFHDRGVLAAIVGGICGAILLRPVRQGLIHRRLSQTLRLSGLAFLSGPLAGVILASLTVLLSDVSPMDRGYTLGCSP